MPLPHVKIILVRPRDPNNIGAAARAMKNFGFTELAVVAPDWGGPAEASAANCALWVFRPRDASAVGLRGNRRRVSHL